MYSAHTLTQPVCTLRPGCAYNAVSQRALGRVVTRTGAVLWLSPIVSQACHSAYWPCRKPCRASTLQCREPPPVTIQKLYRDPTLAACTARRVVRAPSCIVGHVVACCCRVAARCCHVTTLYQSFVAPYCDTNGRPQARYNFFCIVTHPWPSHAHMRAPLALLRRLALSWPLAGRVVGLCRKAS